MWYRPLCFILALFTVGGARADQTDQDLGCKVLLCLANPQGPKAASACVAPIDRLFWHLARGHAFPTCDMGAGNASGTSSRHDFANPNFCPPQYRRYVERDNGLVPYCLYLGAVSVTVNQQPYVRVWWNLQGTVTENVGAAKNLPGASHQFEQDLTAWQIEQQRVEDERQRQARYYGTP